MLPKPHSTFYIADLKSQGMALSAVPVDVAERICIRLEFGDVKVTSSGYVVAYDELHGVGRLAVGVCCVDTSAAVHGVGRFAIGLCFVDTGVAAAVGYSSSTQPRCHRLRIARLQDARYPVHHQTAQLALRHRCMRRDMRFADLVDHTHRLDIEATECFDAERSELSVKARRESGVLASFSLRCFGCCAELSLCSVDV